MPTASRFRTSKSETIERDRGGVQNADLWRPLLDQMAGVHTVSILEGFALFFGESESAKGRNYEEHSKHRE